MLTFITLILHSLQASFQRSAAVPLSNRPYSDQQWAGYRHATDSILDRVKYGNALDVG